MIPSYTDCYQPYIHGKNMKKIQTNQEASKQQHKTSREVKGETVTSKETKGW